MKKRIIVEVEMIIDIDDEVSDKVVANIVRSHPLHLDVVSSVDIGKNMRTYYSLKTVKKRRMINLLPRIK